MAKKLTDDALPNVADDTLAACLTWLTEIEVEEMRLKARKAARWRGFEAEGVNKDAAKRMHALSKLDDDEREQRLVTEQRYLRLTFDFGADGQGSFAAAFAAKPRAAATKPLSVNERRLSIARAHGDGYNTGFAGGDIGFCKFPAGSEEYVSWRDGWTDGADDRRATGKDAKKPKEEKAAQPRKRGRPSKADRAARSNGDAAHEDVAGHA